MVAYLLDSPGAAVYTRGVPERRYYAEDRVHVAGSMACRMARSAHGAGRTSVRALARARWKAAAVPPLAEVAFDEAAGETTTPGAFLHGARSASADAVATLARAVGASPQRVRAHGATRQRVLLYLQRTHGNAYVQRFFRDGVTPREPVTPVVPAGSGEPLAPEHRVAFERALAHPLDHVRVHTGADEDQAARALGAQAFTIGSHVYFAEGSYAPGTPDGDRKLGHELTHVVQHDAGRVPPPDRSSPSAA